MPVLSGGEYADEGFFPKMHPMSQALKSLHVIQATMMSNHSALYPASQMFGNESPAVTVRKLWLELMYDEYESSLSIVVFKNWDARYCLNIL